MVSIAAVAALASPVPLIALRARVLVEHLPGILCSDNFEYSILFGKEEGLLTCISRDVGRMPHISSFVDKVAMKYFWKRFNELALYPVSGVV
jgi:hypothetical protein